MASSAPAAPAGARHWSLQSAIFPDRFIRHRGFAGYIEPVASDMDRGDATFKRTRGLAEGAQLQLESANHPGHFLVVEGDRLVLRQRPPVDRDFDARATFIQHPRPGGAGLSLESHAQRGKYLRHTGFVLFVHAKHDSDLFRQDASFVERAAHCSGAGCVR